MNEKKVMLSLNIDGIDVVFEYCMCMVLCDNDALK